MRASVPLKVSEAMRSIKSKDVEGNKRQAKER